MRRLGIVAKYLPNMNTVAIDTPGGNLSLKIKSRAQQITLKPNIIKVKKILANVSLFTIQHLRSNLEFTGYGMYYLKHE
jgi:hypothetical protein